MPGETVLRPFLKGSLLFLRWEGSHSAILKPWGTWKACSFFPGLRVNASFRDSKPRLLSKEVRKTLLIIFHETPAEITPANFSVRLIGYEGARVLLGKGGQGQIWKEQQREERGWEMSSTSNPRSAQDTPRSPSKSEYCCIPPGLLQASPVAQW